MKAIQSIFTRFLLGIICISFMFIFSCSKDATQPSVSVGLGIMKATIGGTTYNLSISKIYSKGSGDSLSYWIVGTDSIHTVTIAFKDIQSIQVTNYPCGSLSDGKGGYVYAFYEVSNNSSSYNCDGISSSGNIKILSSSSSSLTGTFSLNTMNTDDTTQILKITGEFNGAVYPAEGIDLPILPNTMNSIIGTGDNAQKYNFITIAGVTTFGEKTTLNITGTLNDKNVYKTIIIQFVNFQPEIGIQYTTGIQDKDSSKYITLTYVEGSKSFVADSTNSGIVKIYKKTIDNVQGTFSFIGKNINNPQQKVAISQGEFSAKIKQY